MKHDAIASVVKRIGGNPWARRLTYAIRNRRVFDDLYQHDRMLADRVRLDAYRAAFAKYIKPGDVVVDLGTGTGVLAFLAARAGARVVHAIDHGPIIELAREVARDNGITNVVFHRCHSTSFELPKRADVIIHEQIGDSAYDERVIENIADLRKRVLKPGGRILPDKLAMFVEPVELKDGFDASFAWQQRIDGISFRALRARSATQPHSYWYRAFRPFPFGRFLGEPAPLVDIDLSKAVRGDLPRRLSSERTVVSPAGRFDGFCVYFNARFNGEVSFSSSPAGRPTNWGNALLRVEPREVGPGESIRLHLKAKDLADPESWHWTAD
jgi:protein arginine N-methyltransferase 1